MRDIELNAKVSLAGLRVLLIGAGGAAAGVLGPLMDARPSQVTVVNRNAARASALVDRYLGTTRSTVGAPATAEATGETAARLSAGGLADASEAFDVVINATSSSLAGSASPVSPRVLRPGTLAIDLMYGATAEPFLRWAGDHGAVSRDGLGMLVEQAAESFDLFRGRRPDTRPVLAALRARLESTAPTPAVRPDSR